MDKDIYETNDRCVNKRITPAENLIRSLISNRDFNLVDEIRNELNKLKNENCNLADGLAYLSSFIDDLVKKPLEIFKSLPETTAIEEKLDLKFKKLKELDTKISLLVIKNESVNFSEIFTDDNLEKICPFNSKKKNQIIDKIDKTIEANVEMKRNMGKIGAIKVKCGYLIDYLDIIDEYINSITEFKHDIQQLRSLKDEGKDGELKRAIHDSSKELVDKFERFTFTKSVRDQSIEFCLNLIKA